MTTEPTTKPPDLTEIAAALEAAWPGARDVSLRAVPESHSGFTYWAEAEREGRRTEAVLRLPPPGARPVGPADVARQARIMDTLASTPVPVPEILAFSTDPVIDGRPFVLMAKVEGDRPDAALKTMTPHALMRTAFETIDLIGAVPPPATGIGDEAVTEPAVEVRRWTALRERAPAELVSRAPALEAKLLGTRPATGPVRLVHGDYHPGNLVFREGRVAAVLDWEIAHLGVTASDKAGLCLLAIRKRFGERYSGEAAAIPLEDMVAMADEPHFEYVLAATCHKYAAILGYNLGLHRRGRRIDPVYEGLTRTIPGLIDVGLELMA
ncbi:phosphotransferase family protein [Streptomyces sp. RTd22]|uniref:phosphotransferase family protein n=1 Tax=Streptomyces sp. RTd22 TaxID=1841249 RepID=UPI0007C5C88C|nr:phosphotransferase family protein [Streptomyces sp. RTd22]